MYSPKLVSKMVENIGSCIIEFRHLIQCSGNVHWCRKVIVNFLNLKGSDCYHFQPEYVLSKLLQSFSIIAHHSTDGSFIA